MAIEIVTTAAGNRAIRVDDDIEWMEEEPGWWVLRTETGQELATVRDFRERGERITWSAGQVTSLAPNLEEAIRQATFNATRVVPAMQDAAEIDQEQLDRTRAALDWVDADGD